MRSTPILLARPSVDHVTWVKVGKRRHCCCHSKSGGPASPPAGEPSEGADNNVTWAPSDLGSGKQVSFFPEATGLWRSIDIVPSRLSLRKGKSFISPLGVRTPITRVGGEGGHCLLSWLCGLEPAQPHSLKQRCQSSPPPPLWLDGGPELWGFGADGGVFSCEQTGPSRPRGWQWEVLTWEKEDTLLLGPGPAWPLGTHTASDTHGHLSCSPLTRQPLLQCIPGSDCRCRRVCKLYLF